ncbi:tetratricopeptide repeat protein [Betaproteobacteria bacterium LSUCC0117]|nr:tetratricopeptide repeat protein [Betaproteobacteria bacterium LSUCC0117]
MKEKIPHQKPLAISVEDWACERAVNEMDIGNHQEALAILDGLLAKNPRHYLARLNRGQCLSVLGRHEEAVRDLYAMHERAPDDLRVLKICGIAHTRGGHFEMAMQFLQRYTKAKPNDYAAWESMASAAIKMGLYTNALMYATQALGLEPLNPNAYNNLGATLIAVNRLYEAEQAFQTALAIDPNNAYALSNLGTIAFERDNFAESIKHYEAVLAKVDVSSYFGMDLLYRSSFAYLGVGQLREGWRRYDYGFCPTDRSSRRPKRKFGVPQWAGEPLREKRLLVWGEQGLGDELWFFGMLNEVLALCQNVIVECDPRLVSLLQRSFPSVLVRPSRLTKANLLDSTDFDLHIPVGSLMSLFVLEIEDVKKYKPYIKPEKNIKDYFLKRLLPYRGKKLIGVCWRSGKIDSARSKHYLSIEDLISPLISDDAIFVNLQYGPCEEELSRVEEKYGIKIIRWEDIDLKDNLEQVAALISTLDIVVSAGTAVAEMAMAVGQQLIVFGPFGWRFLGQSEFPWGENVLYFTPTDGDELKSVIPRIKFVMDNNLIRNIIQDES